LAIVASNRMRMKRRWPHPHQPPLSRRIRGFWCARLMAGVGVGAEYPVADSYLSDFRRHTVGGWLPVSGADPWLEDADDHVSAAEVRTSAGEAYITKSLRRLWLSPYRERLMVLCIFHVLQPFGYYGFGTLAALVLVNRGYDVTSSLLFTALSYIGYPIGSLLSIPLLKRVSIW
jgi:hypothetical protein